ncbi:MAG: 4-hydroxy-3-methylbut-2-enyl diphosphate reductase [Bacteroidales bacterium]|nr:4-hydroxy-3-methylbut-2-enyl diphosphate reductase [Bacteroidales bacterium]
MVVIEIDPEAGFCFGVEQVIKTAETCLEGGQELYGLGEMVHNSEEVQRLHALGLKTIDHHDLVSLKPERILLRAHGEPPSTYKLAETHRIEVIDGTCPIVSRLQKKVKEAYDSMDHDIEQLVIFGKADHPETIGLLGQVGGDAVVVSSYKDITKVDPSKKVYLFSQTTMDPDRFEEVERALKDHLEGSAESSFRSDCTICSQMKKRKPGLASFVVKYDLILFVSGKNSSNGKMLYEFCKSINPQTYWISRGSEVDPEWLSCVGTIGISGATSTSISQLESVSKHVKKLTAT